MLKLIVVTVDGKLKSFSGENVSAYYDDNTDCLLINNFEEKAKPWKVAMFKDWNYWYYAKEMTEGEDAPDTHKYITRDDLEKWFFDGILYSSTYQEPRTLAGEYHSLEEQLNTIEQTYQTIKKNIDDKLEAELFKSAEECVRKQKDIEEKIVDFFNENLSKRLAHKYLKFFPESKWYKQIE